MDDYYEGGSERIEENINSVQSFIQNQIKDQQS